MRKHRQQYKVSDEEERINIRNNINATAKSMAIGMMADLKRSKELRAQSAALQKEIDKRQANGTLPKAIPKEVPVKEPKTLKRKKQLEEMEMIKKEIEKTKIPDIKLNDGGIEGMITKLDALTKSKVLRKQVKYLLEEFEKDMITNIIGILFKIDILINKLY